MPCSPWHQYRSYVVSLLDSSTRVITGSRQFPPISSYPSDPGLAFETLNTHASITGNATSQSLLGFFYATGYHDVTKVDQAKAQLYYTFAAAGGHRGAQMALGYRYWTGIGVREDCTKAVEWYERAARQGSWLALPLTASPLTITYV